jgi:hypothetical protein
MDGIACAVSQRTYRLWSRVPLRAHPVTRFVIASRPGPRPLHSLIGSALAVKAARTWFSLSCFVFNYSTRIVSTFLDTAYPHCVSWLSLLTVRDVRMQVLCTVCVDCTCFVVTSVVTVRVDCTDMQSPARDTVHVHFNLLSSFIWSIMDHISVSICSFSLAFYIVCIPNCFRWSYGFLRSFIHQRKGINLFLWGLYRVIKSLCGTDDYSAKNTQKYFKQFQSLIMIT